jgi:RNA polymerase sigma-70 factor (ECF subfamily)
VVGTLRTDDVETDADFGLLADPFRRELLVHCYRMLGGLDEAEDLVQETYLRAWLGYGAFEGRSSLRTWLYRIATNVCLTALAGRHRRPLPALLGEASPDVGAVLQYGRPGTRWIDPIPDVLLAAPADPAAVAVSRDGVRLAFIAALQYLPPRQRAVLILRDVLAWRAAEVADLLGMTTVAVKSSLQRARSRLAVVDATPEQAVRLPDADLRDLLERYVAAFENADIHALMRVLTDDAALEMPPHATWFRGATVPAFLAARVLAGPGAMRLLVVGANGQPAVAVYVREADRVHRAHALHVLTVTPAGISRIVAFLDVGLFGRFGLPHVYAGS